VYRQIPSEFFLALFLAISSEWKPLTGEEEQEMERDLAAGAENR